MKKRCRVFGKHSHDRAQFTFIKQNMRDTNLTKIGIVVATIGPELLDREDPWQIMSRSLDYGIMPYKGFLFEFEVR